LFYNFRSYFKSTYPLISLKYWPLKIVKPSFLTSKTSSTYTLIELWCKLTSKILLITFLQLLFLKNYGMLKVFWRALSLLPKKFIVFNFFFITSMGIMRKGSQLLNCLQARGKVTPYEVFYLPWFIIKHSQRPLHKPLTMSFHP